MNNNKTNEPHDYIKRRIILEIFVITKLENCYHVCYLMNREICRRVEEWMDGWMDGWMDR
jgi:hypothetical protein